MAGVVLVVEEAEDLAVSAEVIPAEVVLRGVGDFLSCSKNKKDLLRVFCAINMLAIAAFVT